MSFGVHSEVGRLRKVMVHRPGLEHTRLTPSNAEELLFDQAAGLTARTRVDSLSMQPAKIRSAFDLYVSAGNIQRLASYFVDAEARSPYSDNDDLETRGATWAFLRYAADRVNGNDAAATVSLDLSAVLDDERSAQRTTLSGDAMAVNTLANAPPSSGTQKVRFRRRSRTTDHHTTSARTTAPPTALTVAAVTSGAVSDSAVKRSSTCRANSDATAPTCRGSSRGR